MSYNEFIAALNVYVRTDEDENHLDTRHDRVAELARGDVPEDMLAYLETSDLAAMLSGSVCVRDPLKADALIKRLEVDHMDDEMGEAAALPAVQRLLAHNDMPLACKPDGVSNKVLDKLIKTPNGCLMYLRIVSLLAQAQHENVAGIYRLPKAKPAHELITAPMDPESRDLD